MSCRKYTARIVIFVPRASDSLEDPSGSAARFVRAEGLEQVQGDVPSAAVVGPGAQDQGQQGGRRGQQQAEG